MRGTIPTGNTKDTKDTAIDLSYLCVLGVLGVDSAAQSESRLGHHRVRGAHAERRGTDLDVPAAQRADVASRPVGHAQRPVALHRLAAHLSHDTERASR